MLLVKLLRRTIIVFSLAGFIQVQAAESLLENKEVQSFISDLVDKDQFKRSDLEALFAQTKRQQSILNALNRPAERTVSYKNYKPMFISAETLKYGHEFWQEHRVALERAEYVYGVPAEVILSIIAIESRFGRLKGKYRVMDALSTIAFYHPRRSAYFKRELREFLLLTRVEKVDPLTIKGSYAGAMGYPQFMPSSFRAYAVDFDFDGHIDIWENPVDAIGSVASYFSRHGWTAEEPVTIRAHVSGDDFESIMPEKMELKATMADAKAAGWQPLETVADEEKVIPFKLEGEQGMEYWIGLKNFYVITRYNRSRRYAMTVHQLSQEFGADGS